MSVKLLCMISPFIWCAIFCTLHYRELTSQAQRKNPDIVQSSPSATVPHKHDAFGEHGFPNLTGFSLAKTRRFDCYKLAPQTRYLSFLRNVNYICHFSDYGVETGDYRRILEIATASSSEKIGTLLLLCMTPMPFIAVPV